MYLTIDSNIIPEEYKNYKLCYIDSISQTIYDYTPEDKKIIESPGFKWEDYKTAYGYSTLRCQDLPNPDYVPGEKEMYAYFTPKNIDEQWGDDWNDSPYEYNAEEPYDHIFVEEEKDGKTVHTLVEHTIIKIPFALRSWNSTIPSDYGGGNSPFCVDAINRGAVAWIYDYNYENHKSVAIYAGISPEEFIDKINQIHVNNPNWVLDEDD